MEKNHTLKVQLLILLEKKGKEQQVMLCIMSKSQYDVQVATVELHYFEPLSCGQFTCYRF